MGSRFQVHDELTAPRGSLPLLRAATRPGYEYSKLLGVLAGSPALLRGYARLRSELRHGALPAATRVRIALGVAHLRRDDYLGATLERAARSFGLGLDDILGARELSSSNEAEEALLRYAGAVARGEAPPPRHVHEEALERGCREVDLLESIGAVGATLLGSLVADAAELSPEGGSPRAGLTLAA